METRVTVRTAELIVPARVNTVLLISSILTVLPAITEETLRDAAPFLAPVFVPAATCTECGTVRSVYLPLSF